MGSSNFANTILGEAVRAAVDSTAEQLNAASGKVEAQEARDQWSGCRRVRHNADPECRQEGRREGR